MNVDLLDPDGVIITTAAFDDAYWNAAAGQLSSEIAPSGMALAAPGSSQPERRVSGHGGFQAWVQSANVNGDPEFGASRKRRAMQAGFGAHYSPQFGWRETPQFGGRQTPDFGGRRRRRPDFGIGDVVAATASKAFYLPPAARDLLGYGVVGTVAALAVKAAGASLAGSLAGAAGAVALAAYVVKNRA